MIAICPKCKNHKWNKTVEGNHIICPECGATWSFKKKALYVITGCSGVGKTTTAQELQKLTTDYVVLDADIFYNIMPHESEEDDFQQIEQMYSISNNISQCGKSVVWAMAGNIDKLLQVYQARFFSEIRVLALVCGEETLRIRMTEGRGITDEGWIRSSVEYNEYFRTHEKIGEVPFSTMDIGNKSPVEAAKCVLHWLNITGNTHATDCPTTYESPRV